jgi:hypothetical protein
MMPVVTYRVEVYRRNIAQMFLPSGDAGKWIYKVSSEMIAAARAEAPRRSGALRAAHRIERRSLTDTFFGNQYAAAYEIRNDADHASWVHEGTDDIEAVMRVPRGSARGALRGAQLPKRLVFYTDGKGKRSTGVRGQKANPWLNRACAAVSMRYGAVPYRI